MFRKYILKPAAWHQQPLDFEWDAESGEVRGADADKVLDMVASATKAGYVVGHPHPTSYDITDPLHNVAQMAVVLGQGWMLDDDLSNAYPSPDEDDDTLTLVDDKGIQQTLTAIH